MNQKDKNGNTLLHIVGDVEHAKALVDAGADINVKNKGGETPLYKACFNDNFELVKFFIENGADKNNICWVTANKIKRYLVQAGCPAGETLIKEFGTDEQKKDLVITFEDACKNFDNTKLYIKQGGDINKQNSRGFTLLCYAVESDQIEWVKFLIENGIDQFIKDKTGSVASMFDTTEKEIYTILKDSINVPDDNGNTLLHLAASKNGYTLIKHLISIGAKFDIVNNYGKTAIELCSDKSIFKSREELLYDYVNSDVEWAIRTLMKKL